jgi:hypothetical protein
LGKDIDKVQPLLDLLGIGLAVSGAGISAEKISSTEKRQALQRFISALEESIGLA